MRGAVFAMNRGRDLIAVETESGFTIIEANTSDFEVGDVLTWNNDTGLGPEVYRNETQGVSINVCVQNHGVRRRELRQQLLMTQPIS